MSDNEQPQLIMPEPEIPGAVEGNPRSEPEIQMPDASYPLSSAATEKPLLRPTSMPAAAAEPERRKSTIAKLLHSQSAGADGLIQCKTEREGRVISKSFGMRTVKLIKEEDERLFDRVLEYKQRNPQSTYKDALKEFGSEPESDAVIKSVYGVKFYDFILKFLHEKEDEKRKKHDVWRQNYEQLLLEAGLILDYEETVDGKGIYIKILAPFEGLCKEAEQQKLFLPLVLDLQKDDENKNQSVGHLAIAAVNEFVWGIQDTKPPTGCFRTDNLKKYVGGDVAKLGWEVVKDEFFTSSHRILLTYGIIVDIKMRNYKKGKVATIRHLLRDGVYTEFFPLHDGTHRSSGTNMRAMLNKRWVKAYFAAQPLEDVRQYMGEKVALYFAWLGFYTKFLFVASIVGFIVFLYGAANTRQTNPDATILQLMFDNRLSPYYSLFIALWATMFLEYWKRENATLAYRWSTLEFEKNEPDRPDFKPTNARKSPITGKYERYFPGLEYKKRMFVSALCVGLAIVIVLFALAANIVFRVFCASQFDKTWASVVSAIASLITIMILARLYQGTAEKLTKWENHRTETAFEDALIAKKFIFDFVNTYVSLFYIGLFKQHFGGNILGSQGWNDVCSSSCLVDLMVQLCIIFVGKQFIGQVQEGLIPFINKRKNEAESKKAMKQLLSKYGVEVADNDPELEDPEAIPQWVKDDALGKFGGLTGEYNEMALQFGFMTLFVTAFPLGPFFALLNNIFEIRLDAGKMIKSTQRPIPFQAQDIGTWFKILEHVSNFAVLTNGALIAFTSKDFEETYLKQLGNDTQSRLIGQIVFLFLFEHFVFGLKYLFSTLIPDVPPEVKKAIEREEYLADVTVNGNPPAEDDAEALAMLGLGPSGNVANSNQL